MQPFGDVGHIFCLRIYVVFFIPRDMLATPVFCTSIGVGQLVKVCPYCGRVSGCRNGGKRSITVLPHADFLVSRPRS